MSLTDGEKKHNDFTRTHGLHARIVEGRMQNAGVDDWLAFSDPTLPIDEHNPEKATLDERGPWADVHDTEAKQIKRHAEAFRTVQAEA